MPTLAPFCALVLSALLATTAAGQTGAPPSAANASPTTAEELATVRATYRAAIAASQLKNWDSSRVLLDRALALWPTHPTYVRSLALIAARQGDTSGVRSGFTRYADLGLGFDPAPDTVLEAWGALPSFTEAAWRLKANVAPLARSTVERQLTDSTLYPEGVTHDPRTGSYYVASVRHRTIVEVRADGGTRDLLPRGTPGLGAMFGVRLDPTRRSLWATTSGLPQMEGYAPADSAIAAILRISIPDGRIEQRFDVPPAPQGHTLGDLDVTARGDVFVTDSRSPLIYVLARGADSLRTITHPLFRSLQGVVATSDGADLIVADYANGLLRVRLQDGSVVRLAESDGVTTLGVDGIALVGNDVIAVQNGLFPPRVMRFTLDSARARVVRAEVLDRNVAIADEPTIGTIVGDAFVYVANSQWEKYGEDGKLLPDARLKRPILLRLPLR